MKLKIPFIGFIEKTIQTDIIQQFLNIFRNTEDIHRVLIFIPLVWFISHSWYMKNQPHISVIFFHLQRSEIIWLVLLGFLIFFVFSWAVFSSEFNPALYMRQLIFGTWTLLTHRLYYGLETPGTPLFSFICLGVLTGTLPFAFTGLRIDQLYNRFKENRHAEKNKREDPVIQLDETKSGKI